MNREDDSPEEEELFARWQTEKWEPPFVGPSDEIPLNQFRNVELALLNPGLTHIPQQGASIAARRLGVP
jgi:hypothetical protein